MRTSLRRGDVEHLVRHETSIQGADMHLQAYIHGDIVAGFNIDVRTKVSQYHVKFISVPKPLPHALRHLVVEQVSVRCQDAWQPLDLRASIPAHVEVRAEISCFIWWPQSPCRSFHGTEAQEQQDVVA